MRRTCGFVAMLLLIAALGAHAQNTSTVNFGTTYQTIRGFGASTAWTAELTTAQANAVWGTTGSELGLTINRARIDPGGSANWATELANAKLATSLGAVEIASPWTPPTSMKSNGSTVMGSLNTSSYAAYATFLESFVTYMSQNGVSLYAISMQNEPDANVSYESCVWTAAQMDTWVANNASVLTTKLIMPESESFIQSMSDTALNDPNAVSHIGIIGGHLYGVSPAYYTNAENHSKEVWMTEHYLSPSGSTAAISDAIAAAEEVHNSLTVGQYNAYVWWWIAQNSGGANINYGLVDTSGNPTYYGYALGQFSRFVRPGAVRVAASSPLSGVYVSAYKNSTGGAIVAINSNSAAESVSFALQGLTATSASPYETTSQGGLIAESAVSVSSSAFTYTLPAQSIVTFVLSGSASSCATAPSAPTGLAATAASTSGINLSWSTVTAPTNCSISGYQVFRGTTSGFTPSSSNEVATVTSGATYSDTGLAASTTYYYVVEAVDAAGNSAASTQASATTQSAATCGTVPSAPSTLTATAASSSGINLSWGSVTAPTGCSISGYKIYRGTTSGFTPSSSNLVASVTSGTSYSDTGLAASTTYYYVVEAVDTYGSSTASTQASATTQAASTGFACHVTYTVSSQWSGGFTGAISIGNTGTQAITSWSLTWTYANGQTITQAWNATAAQSGANVTLTNLSYNGSIAAGGTLTGIGFNGSWNNSTNAVPTSFAVNGTTCK